MMRRLTVALAVIWAGWAFSSRAQPSQPPAYVCLPAPLLGQLLAVARQRHGDIDPVTMALRELATQAQPCAPPVQNPPLPQP